MNLSHGLAGMPDGFKLKSVGYVGADHAGRPLIKIRYIGASNAHDTIDAVRE
jgi:putative heme iron utilization protein